MSKFEKGEVANPSGRPKGSGNKKLTLFRGAIEDKSGALINKALALALDGDTKMLTLCIDKILPSLRPVDAPLELPELAGKRNIITLSKKIFDYTAKGEIGINQCKDLLGAIGDLNQIKEFAEFEKRLSKLEKTTNETEPH